MARLHEHAGAGRAGGSSACLAPQAGPVLRPRRRHREDGLALRGAAGRQRRGAGRGRDAVPAHDRVGADRGAAGRGRVRPERAPGGWRRARPGPTRSCWTRACWSRTSRRWRCCGSRARQGAAAAVAPPPEKGVEMSWIFFVRGRGAVVGTVRPDAAQGAGGARQPAEGLPLRGLRLLPGRRARPAGEPRLPGPAQGLHAGGHDAVDLRRRPRRRSARCASSTRSARGGRRCG